MPKVRRSRLSLVLASIPRLECTQASTVGGCLFPAAGHRAGNALPGLLQPACSNRFCLVHSLLWQGRGEPVQQAICPVTCTFTDWDVLRHGKAAGSVHVLAANAEH